MPEPQQDLNFSQYSVLIGQISNLRDELRSNTEQLDRIVQDHENRLRRNEVIGIVSLFSSVLVGFILYLILR